MLMNIYVIVYMKELKSIIIKCIQQELKSIYQIFLYTSLYCFYLCPSCYFEYLFCGLYSLFIRIVLVYMFKKLLNYGLTIIFLKKSFC